MGMTYGDAKDSRYTKDLEEMIEGDRDSLVRAYERGDHKEVARKRASLRENRAILKSRKS